MAASRGAAAAGLRKLLLWLLCSFWLFALLPAASAAGHDVSSGEPRFTRHTGPHPREAYVAHGRGHRHKWSGEWHDAETGAFMRLAYDVHTVRGAALGGAACTRRSTPRRRSSTLGR